MELMNVGQNVALFLKKDLSFVEILCKIEQVFEDRLVLALPKYFMRYIELLQVGCKLTAKVISPFGTLDFNSVVISSPLEENFSIEFDKNAYNLSPNGEKQSLQVFDDIEIKYSGKTLHLKTLEISPTEIIFSSKEKFKVDDIIEASIYLPNNYGIIKFKGIISDFDKSYPDEYTAKYISMDEQNRKLLLYYIYMNTDL